MIYRPVTGSLLPRGFTLVEMALVVAIIGVLLTMGLGTLTVQYNAAAISATQKRQESVKDALVSYLRTHKRLPCPEITGLDGTNAPTGEESRDPTTQQCQSYVGTIPWRDLGISRDLALDGYGNFFTYYVASAKSTGEPDWTLLHVLGGTVGFNVGNLGRLDVLERGLKAKSLTGTYYDATPPLAAVVIVSHGKNGFGAVADKGTRIALPATPNICEKDNAPPAAAALPTTNYPSPIVTLYATSNPPPTCDAGYDDIVMTVWPNDLLTPIIKDGAIPSAEAMLAQQFQSLKALAIAKLLSNGCIPVPLCTPHTPPPCLLPPDDPWGQTIQYNRISTVQLMSETIGEAFTLKSFGADRSNGGDDDKLLTVSYSDIRTSIPSASCP